MNFIPIKTGLLTKDPVKKIINKIKSEGIPIEQGDVLVFTSKIISYDENRLVKLDTHFTSEVKEVSHLGSEYDLDPSFAQLVLEESDEILGGVKKAILTLKDGILIANAGIDQSNVPKGYAILWPKDPTQSAQKLQQLIKKEFRVDVGIIISDSQCTPARRGTTALAIAISGFEGLVDERGKADLFDRKLQITYHNLADELASAANVVMGERNQAIPVVIIKNAPIKLSNKSAKILTKELIIDKEEDLFGKLYQ